VRITLGAALEWGVPKITALGSPPEVGYFRNSLSLRTYPTLMLFPNNHMLSFQYLLKSYSPKAVGEICKTIWMAPHLSVNIPPRKEEGLLAYSLRVRG